MTIATKQHQPVSVAYPSDCFGASGREWNIMTYAEGVGIG